MSTASPRPASPASGDQRPASAHRALLAIVLATAAGCGSLPRGDVSAVAARSLAPRAGQVYLLRGWHDLWSEGVDALAQRIAAEGIRARVFRVSQADDLAAALLGRSAAAADADPLVLIGFSFGADEAIRIARKLDVAKRPIALLVTIDPVTPPDVPANVPAARNFYQSNGVLDAIPWLRGVPLRPPPGEHAAAGRVQNVNVRQRKDLLEPGTSHRTIAANAKVHGAIVAEVLRVCPMR